MSDSKRYPLNLCLFKGEAIIQFLLNYSVLAKSFSSCWTDWAGIFSGHSGVAGGGCYGLKKSNFFQTFIFNIFFKIFSFFIVCLSDHNSGTPGPICLTFLLGDPRECSLLVLSWFPGKNCLSAGNLGSSGFPS